MRIRRITLKKYKRFADLTIDLGNNPKRIVALVGPNGCGKSSVFDAMLYLVNSFGQIGGINNSDYMYHSLDQNPGYKSDNIDIEFDKGPFFEIFKHKRQNGTHKTIISFRSSFRYNGSLKVSLSEALSELRQNDYGASFSAGLDQRMEQNYRRLNVMYNKLMHEHDLRPSEAREELIKELNLAIGNCLNLTIDNLGNIEAGQGTIYFKKTDTAKAFEYNVLSSGEKEIVDILLDLFLRRDGYSDSIYIIDEPELHLNTSIQRKLLHEIDRIIPKDCQLWIATHSIGFLRALQDDFSDVSQIIEFKEENQWGTQAYVLESMVKSHYNWRNLFSTALDDLSALISPKRIVYCEGRAEPSYKGTERGFDARVYNMIFGERYSDTLFVSSGGNTELDQRSEVAFHVLTKALPSLEILVLKDRDMVSSQTATNFERDLYLHNNPPNHRVLKRHELENYLFDKEILKLYCTKQKLEFDESGYDKLIKDIENQEVKSLAGQIKNLCSIQTSINQEVFKLNLAKEINAGTKTYRELEKAIFHSS